MVATAKDKNSGAATPATVRRSTRTRTKAATHYDEAAQAEKSSRKAKKKDNLDSDEEESADE
jgi:hypothetical protein